VGIDILAAEGDPTRTLEELGALSWSDWVTAASLIIGSILLALIARRIIERFLSAKLVPFVSRLIARLAAFVLVLFGFFYSMQQVGVSLAPLLGLLGLFGLALAFAFQEVLENFIAGIFLAARRPFGQGDEISTADHEGLVEDISLRELTLRTYDGELVYIPNSVVWQNPIVNHTARPVRRTTVGVGVAYDTDLEVAGGVLLQALRSVPGVAEGPPPQALAHQFGPSSIDFALRFWHNAGIADEWLVRDGVVKAAHRALGEAGIEIPFPQRVVTFVGDGKPVGERSDA
jgi:small conductance mechanosensitive channel